MAERIIPQGPSDLPPAGHARNEELARRKDSLEQAAEQHANAVEAETISPKAFEVDNELAEHWMGEFNELAVSSQDPMYHYVWEQAGFFGRFIKSKCALGWEVVQGDMPEAIELKGIGADTTRRLGDVILMRIRKDRWLMIEKQRKDRQRAVESGDAQKAAFQEMADNFSARTGHEIPVRTEMDEVTLRRLHNRAEASRRGEAKVDELLREGRMPGMAAPGRR